VNVEEEMKRLVAFIAVACSVLCLQAAAQNKGAIPARQSASHFSTQPFDLAATKLPPSYLGHNADQIWNAFKQKRLTKSEFETEAAYESRLDGIANTPIAGGILPNGTFAFLLSKLEKTYDAEQQVLRVTLPIGGTSSIVTDENITAQWMQRSAKQGEFIGSNAFGVKRRITRKAYLDTNLTGKRPEWLDWETEQMDEFSEPKALLPMSPDAARLSKVHVGMLFIGAIQPPFISADEQHETATIDSPEESTTYIHNLNLALQQIWLYDVQSGQVLAKLSAEEHKKRWPLHVQIKGEKYSGSSIVAEVDDSPIQRKGKTLQTTFHVDANREVRLTIKDLYGDSPSEKVFVNGSPATDEWDCEPVHKYSSIKNCSMTIRKM
jgi:hypothetical protein